MRQGIEKALAGLASRAPGLVLLIFVGAPRWAEACAVCSAGREDETRTAFIVTTAGMTALPFVLVGGMVWYVRRRFIEAEKAERRERSSESTPSQ